MGWDPVSGHLVLPGTTSRPDQTRSPFRSACCHHLTFKAEFKSCTRWTSISACSLCLLLQNCQSLLNTQYATHIKPCRSVQKASAYAVPFLWACFLPPHPLGPTQEPDPWRSLSQLAPELCSHRPTSVPGLLTLDCQPSSGALSLSTRRRKGCCSVHLGDAMSMFLLTIDNCPFSFSFCSSTSHSLTQNF